MSGVAGWVLCALLCGCLPFDEGTIPQLFKKITGGDYTVPKHVTPDAGDLLKRLLCVDPLSRITIPQLRDHPWFQVRRRGICSGAPVVLLSNPVWSIVKFWRKQLYPLMCYL